MFEGVKVGDAYVDVHGDFSSLNSQISAAVGPLTSRFGKLGTAGAVGLGAIVAGAAGAAKGLYEIGEAFDDAYDTIRVKTGATGRELKKLEADFRGVVKRVPADFDAAGVAVSGLNQRLDLTGKPLKRLSAQVLELSRITGTDLDTNVRSITRLFGDWSIETEKQEKTLDRLFRLSQETGIAVGDLSNTLVQFGSPLRTLGLDFDFAAAMVARFEAEGVNVSTLMSGLRLAVANLSDPTDELAASFKEFGITAKEPAEAVMQVFDAIEQTSSTMRGNTLAFEVFGRRAGSDMAAAVREGRFELDELMQTVEGGEETIRRAGRSNMDLAEQWTLLKNNLATELEPTASRVFEEIGDAMKDVRKVATDKSLTQDEKLTELIDMAADAIAEGAPKIAEAGGKLGLELSKGLVGAFWESDLLGKLFIGGAVIRAVGGLETLKAAGTRLGTPIGKALGAAMIAGLIIGDWDEIEDVIKESVLAPLFPEEFGQGRSEELIHNLSTTLDGVVEGVGENATSIIGKEGTKVKLRTAWGNLIFDSETGEVIRAKGQKLEDLVGESAGRVSAVLSDMARGQDVRRDLASMMDFIHGEFHDLPAPIKAAVGQTTLAQARAWRDAKDITRKEFREIKREIESDMLFVSQIIPSSSARAVRGFGHNLGEMTEVTGEAASLVVSTMNDTLSALKVAEVAYTASKGTKAVGKVLDLVNKQRGGWIDAGAPSGDSVPALLERDEYVLNRNAVKAMGGPRVLDQINFGMASRFQSGGGVTVGSSKGLTSIVDVGHYLQSLGFLVGEHPAFGGVAPVHVDGSLHYSGQALDINWVPTEEENAKLDWLYAQLLGDPGVTQLLWQVADHYDHLHLGMAGSGAISIGGVPGGPMLEKIKRVLIEGPEGPLRDLAQAATDKVRRAANAYILDQAPATGPMDGAMPAQGSLQTIARQMVTQAWGADQWAAFSEIVNRESGWNPSAVNASSGAAGLAQALPPSKYPPGAWPYTGKDSAVLQLQWMIDYIQGRYGTPGAALAFHDANNWYQRGGQVGSALRMAGGGSVLGSAARDLGMFLSTAYGPPWDAIEGGPETAHGTPLVKGRKIIAVDPSVIPYGSHIYADPNPYGYKGTWLADDTGGAIIGEHIDFFVGEADGTKDTWNQQSHLWKVPHAIGDEMSGSAGSSSNPKYGEGDFKPGNGGPNEIKRIIKQLKGDSLSKKGRQEAEERLKLLRKRKWKAEARQHERRRRRVRAMIEEAAAMAPYPGLIKAADAASALAEERFGDLQSINSLTDLPDLPEDDVLLGPGGQAILDAYNAAVDSEAAEIKAEIDSASMLLFREVLERNTLLSGIDAAQIRADDLNRKEKGTAADLKAVDAQIRQEERKNKPNQARLRQLRLQRKDLSSKLNAIHAGQKEIRGFTTGAQENLTNLQGTDHDHRPVSLDQLSGGYLDRMPLTRFGGEILGTQSELVRLGKDYEAMTGERIKMPTPDGGSADSELDSLLAEQNAYLLNELRLARIQGPIFEQFFAEARIPRFHDGGVIQGPPGSEQPIMGLAGEGVFTAEQMSAMGAGQIAVYVVVEDGAVDSSRIRTEVHRELTDMTRGIQPNRPAVGQKAVLGRGR